MTTYLVGIGMAAYLVGIGMAAYVFNWDVYGFIPYRVVLV